MSYNEILWNMNNSISIFLLIILCSCSTSQSKTKKKILEQDSWIEHRTEYPDAGFVVKFKYPTNFVIANEIDNCLCVGVNTEHYNKNEASFEDNTRQWCICLFDSTQFTSEYIISSWKIPFNGEVIENRDTVTIGNLKALRVTLKSREPKASYRQLIYLKEYSTLFEIMNVDELTSENFKIFWESIKIEKYRKP